MEALKEETKAVKNEPALAVSEQPSSVKKKKRWGYNRWLFRNIPFYLFLAILSVFYIANGHRAEVVERELIQTEKSIKELSMTYKVVKREVIFRGKQSELARVIAPMGLVVPEKAPIILKSEK